MNKWTPPNPADHESYLKTPSAVFAESVEEIPIQSAHSSASASASYQPTWSDVEHARLLQQQQQQYVESQPKSVGSYVDKFLLLAAGREPLSTLILAAAGCLVAAAQDDPTNWHGWLHGAVIALIGRMMNER